MSARRLSPEVAISALGMVAIGMIALFAGEAGAQTTGPWVIGGDTGVAWRQAVESWIALDDTARPGGVQPLQIPQGWSVTREQTRSGAVSAQRNLFGYRWAFTKGPRLLESDTLTVGWHPRMWQAGGVDATSGPTMRGLVDGDGLAAAFTHPARADGLQNSVTFFTLDFGVPVPIDSVVFYPPQSGLTSDNQRQRELFPSIYEVSRSNTPVEWLIFEDEDVSIGTTGYHPLEEIIGATFSNNTSIVSLTPELGFTRFLRFKFGEETRTMLLAEIQAFGHGYPQQARYLSAPHDFGEPVSLGQVTWKFTRFRQTPSGEIIEDPTAPVELSLRTRAGSDDDPKTYFIFDDLGRLLKVSPEEYFSAPRITERFSEGVAGFRAQRGDDTDDWNNWSVAYERSGDQNRSSDGSRYLQFQFDITTQDPLAFGVLDSIAFEVSPLLADSALAEISLDGVPVTATGNIEVPLGVDTVFVYDVRTVAGPGSPIGYDGMELDVPAAARFLDLEIDGAPAVPGTDFEVVEETGVMRFSFAEHIQRDASFRVRFRSAIFQASVFLEGRIVNSDPAQAALPQSIEAGDARTDVASNALQVIAGDTRFEVLRQIVLSSPVLTPNGDGANDQAVIGFDLFGVTGGNLLVEVFDLSGRRVHAVLADQAVSGPYAPTWDGLDDRGQLVAPGLYLIRVKVEVDEGILTRVQPLAVAY
ncbi:MAG: hypothetical protein O2782_05680 [bacterium]|nr:hypothetical protein [bacterium]